MKPRTQLDPEVWNRIAEVFDRARDAPASERPALLDQLCGSDMTVRREVEEMLEADAGNAALLAERRLADLGSASLTFSDALLPGARVGPYRILELVGSGGMGQIYRAERADGAYRQVVALKVLRPGYRTAEMIRRFRVEREALARLAHPGIAAILDGGTLDDGRPYLVLQFVDGLPITKYCETQALDIRARLRLFMDVAHTVHFAHGRLVIHRDIKPSNILVQADGAVRLLDFGIAKLLDVDSDESLALETNPGARLLTLAHAAPEQLRGELPSTATDVYALGVLLFEMLTGRKPFDSANRSATSLENAILETPPPVPSAVARSRADMRTIRGDLDRIVLMALRKEADRRYSSAEQLAEDVGRYLAGRPVLAQPDSARYRARKFVQRNRALVGGAAALAMMLVAFAVTAGLQARRIAKERDRAARERRSAEDVIGILANLFERADPNKHPGGDTVRITALLDDAEEKIKTFDSDPERQAALWWTVGRMRYARGDYTRAINLLTHAAERRRTTFGPDDLDAARIRHDLALVRQSREGETVAAPLLQASLDDFRRLEGNDGEDVRRAMSDLLATVTDTVASRALREQLLELERRSPSRDPVEVADRLDARATERYGNGDYVVAASLWESAIGLLLGKLPPEHEIVRLERRNLALALAGAGQLVRAESLQRAEVKLEERLPSPAMTRGQAREALALTLVAEQHADSAEREERIALRWFREGGASTHWRIWSAQRNLAIIVAARGRTVEGLALLDSAIEVARMGPDSGSAVGYLMSQRIPFLLELGRTQEASQTMSDAEKRIGHTGSVRADERASVERYAGMASLQSGDPAAAASRFREADRLDAEGPFRSGAGPNFNACLTGIALAAMGRWDEARPLLGAACREYESRGLPTPIVVRWVREARARDPATVVR